MSNNAPTSLHCPTCGAPLDADGTRPLVRCNFCGNVSLLPGFPTGQTAAPASALDQIRKLAEAGTIIEAIRKYREIYGVDLIQAKEAVEALQAGRLVTPSAPGMRAPQELTRALEEVQRLLKAGDQIGAIKVYRENFDVNLTRAKYAVDQIAGSQATWPEAGFPGPGLQTRELRTRSANKWLATGITLAIILFVGGLILFFMFLPGGPLGKHYYPNKPISLLPSGQANNPDIAALFYNPNAESRFIGLVDGATGKMRWQADKLAGDGFANAVVPGPDLLYAANATDLLAYRKSDGSLAWQASMPDKLNYSSSALLVTAGRVITNNANQSLQAYDAESGNLVWSRRLNGYDRSLRLMGDSLVVIDYVDNDYHYDLLLLDPATGSQQNIFTPICISNDFTFDFNTDAGLVFDQADNALFLVYASSYGCVQRLDLTSGQTSWSVTSQKNFNFLPDGFQYLLTDSVLYFSNANDLLALNTSSGTMEVFLTNPDYSLLPLAMAGDKLIVRARRTRGTQRFELWGVDYASGNSTWQLDLQDSSPIDPPGGMVGLITKTAQGWTSQLVPGGLVVIRFQAEPNQLVLETYNPENGLSLGQQIIKLKKVSGDFYSVPTVIGWQGNIVYFILESNIYALDISTAQYKVIY